MKQTLEAVEAVYENGAFRPTNPLDTSIAEGQHVHLTVQVDTVDAEGDPLGMLTNFWDGLSEEEIIEIESIMLDRSNWHTGTKFS